ncbi:MAG: HEAT repeat domain-containing protein [Planctomycetota bacterium]
MLFLACACLASQVGCVYRVTGPPLFGGRIVSHYVSNRLDRIIGFAGGRSRFLVIQMREPEVRVLDVRTGAVMFSMRGTGRIVDGQRKLLVAGGGSGVCVLDLSEDRPVERFRLKGGRGIAVISPDGTHLAAADAIWDLRAGAVVARLPSRSFMLREQSFSADGNLFVAVDQDCALHAWDASAGRLAWSRPFEMRRGKSPSVNVIGFSADNRKLVALVSWFVRTHQAMVEGRPMGDPWVETESELHVLDAGDGSTLHALKGPTIRAAVLTGDRRMLALAGGKGTRLFDLEKLAEAGEVPGSLVWTPALSGEPPDHWWWRQVLTIEQTSGGKPPTRIWLWDRQSLAKVSEMALPAGWRLNQVHFRGRLALLRKDRRVRVVDLERKGAPTLIELEVARGYPGPRRFAGHAAFDYSGRTLALEVDREVLIITLPAFEGGSQRDWSLMQRASAAGAEQEPKEIVLADAGHLLRPEFPKYEELGLRTGVIRSEADLEAHGIEAIDGIDWMKHNVLFMLSRHPSNMGIYKEFRISQVLRYSARIVVRTRIVPAEYTLPAGGPGSHTFHAVLIPKTDLPVAFEILGEVKAAPTPEQIADEIKQVAGRADWWEHRYEDLRLRPGLRPKVPLPNEKQLATDEAVKRIVTGVGLAGPKAMPGIQKLAQSKDANLRCWAIDVLGRSGSKASVELFKKCAKDEKWKIRAAGLLAIGRIAGVRPAADLLEVISDAMDDEERVVGGCFPVALASLQAACGLQGVQGLEIVLKGLKTYPFEWWEYDNSPEPMPLFRVAILPPWYIESASKLCLELGEKSIDALVKSLSRPEHQFFINAAIGTGGIAVPGEKRQAYESLHGFIGWHLERIVGAGKTMEMLAAILEKTPAYPEEALLGAIRTLGEIGEAEALKLLRNLNTVGGRDVDKNPAIKREVDQAVQKIEQRLRTADNTDKATR